jgi:RNA polymerase sigma factor (sigma-70 family)
VAVTEASQVASRALDDLYRAHGAHVYRYALAVLGNHADAEDVTQTTFLNAYRALEQGVHPRKPANWLLTITSNAIKERFRRDQARPREVELDRDVATSVDESDVPSVGELLTALSKIPPQQRQAIVLREFEGRSYAEIAGILGVTTSALETLLFRARRSLTEELAQQLTCTEAQHAISKAADGRLGRKEKRRLQEHVRECPDCAQFARLQERHSKALRGLALIPVPLSFALFKGLEGSASAATLPATAGTGINVGAAATSTSVGGSAAASGGGLLAGGVVVKAAAVVAAATVVGGVTVAGVEHIGPLQKHRHSPPASSTLSSPAKGHAAGRNAGKSHVVHSRRANHAAGNGLVHGKALARGQTGNIPPGQSKHHSGTSAKAAAAHQHAPGLTGSAPGHAKETGKASVSHPAKPKHQTGATGHSTGHPKSAGTTISGGQVSAPPPPGGSSSAPGSSDPAATTPPPSTPPPTSDSSSQSSPDSSSSPPGSGSSSSASGSSSSGSSSSGSDSGSSGSDSHSSNGQGHAYGHLEEGNGKH